MIGSLQRLTLLLTEAVDVGFEHLQHLIRSQILHAQTPQQRVLGSIQDAVVQIEEMQMLTQKPGADAVSDQRVTANHHF